ncbi:tryptophan synthase subunit alpha [Gammaproteobacteria bacterium 45_16_T64]|nr:tryptophan synthase subunit alpha [Gammaproteobacteria bacterium 45_16_T64]
MSRLKTCFGVLASQNRTALIPFLTAGDPHPNQTVDIMHTLVEGGADIIELGIPFSDPMADGPVIQLADERALAHNTSLTDALGMVKEFRKTNTDTPVVLMGYLNPVEVYGYKRFAVDAADVGVDAILTVDLPPEASEEMVRELSDQGLDSIFLIAPTTTDARIKKIVAAGSGYLYYVSVKGVTGSASLDVSAVEARLETIRNSTDLPIAVGFGIKDPVSAKAVGSIADGVVVGSALVNIIAQNQDDKTALLTQVGDFTQSLSDAISA